MESVWILRSLFDFVIYSFWGVGVRGCEVLVWGGCEVLVRGIWGVGYQWKREKKKEVGRFSLSYTNGNKN